MVPPKMRMRERKTLRSVPCSLGVVHEYVQQSARYVMHETGFMRAHSIGIVSGELAS